MKRHWRIGHEWQVPAARFPSGAVPTTLEELFGSALAHLWNSYGVTVGVGTFVDSVGGFNVASDDSDPTVGTTINGRTYPVFDGNDTGLANAGSLTTLDDRSDFCIFGVFKTNNGAAQGAIIDKASCFYIELTGGGVMDCTINTGGAGSGEVLGVTPVDDDVWHRFILTCTAGTMKLYVDGVLEGTDTGVVIDAGSSALQIGEQPNTTVTDSGIAIVGIATRGVTLTEVEYLDAILEAYVTAELITEGGEGLTTEAGLILVTG